MRITEDNINKYINKYVDHRNHLNLYHNKKITHIDYLPDNITYISISNSNVKEITCKLPDGLEVFYCSNSKIKLLPLLPKSLEYFDGTYTNLPIEFQVDISNDNIKCNNLRKLQLLELI